MDRLYEACLQFGILINVNRADTSYYFDFRLLAQLYWKFICKSPSVIFLDGSNM